MKKILFATLILMILTSCATQNLFRTTASSDLTDLTNVDSTYHHILKPDDKLSISIWNHDDLSIGSVFSIYNSNEAYGKWILVDVNGNVELPKIGQVKLGGLNVKEASDTLAKYYSAFLVDPVVVVKVLNREITILGEVRSPGTYILEKERNTITEMIGKAQGFAPYADLQKIQIIRRGKSYSIDLTVLDEFLHQNIILESGDILHIPSKKGKALDQKAPTLIPFASALTAIAVVSSIILK